MTKDFVTKYHDGQSIASKFAHVLAGYIRDYTFTHTDADDEFIITLLMCFDENFAGFYTPSFEGDLRKIVPRIRAFLNTQEIDSFDIDTPDKKYYKVEYLGNKNYCDAGYNSNKIIITITL